MEGKTIAAISQAADLLEQRIAENIRGQQIDLVQWIFERLEVKVGSNVLELCAGTGSQTMRLLSLVGMPGRVTALDASGEALEKIREKADAGLNQRLITVETKMEELQESLEKLGMKPPAFDLIFCGYGLYYSNDPEKTLLDALKWLKIKGRIAIIGPYRENNMQLFKLLQDVGMEIPTFVMYTSRDFMESMVIPWGIKYFPKITLHTVVNTVLWDKPESVLTYWKNSTFYDSLKLSAVKKKVEEHFKHNSFFKNEKWIMLVEMANE